MKTKEEIEKMLADSIEDLAKVQSWHDQALQKYQENRKEFGQADFGEVGASGDQLRDRKTEIYTLKWVLGITI